jgi:hypothetical protein
MASAEGSEGRIETYKANRDLLTLASRVLLGALMSFGRWRRRFTYRAPTDFANAGPPHRLSLTDLVAGIPSRPPLTAGSEEEQVLDDRLPRELVDAGLWTVALDAAANEQLSDLRGLQAISYGFVCARKRLRADKPSVQLGIICYVKRWGLTQKAPLFLEVGGATFPVVLRPIPRDIPAAGARFDRGVTTCRARLFGRPCVLTAAHIFDEKDDPFGVHEGDIVSCVDESSLASCTRQVLAADGVMEAALVDDPRDDSTDSLTPAFRIPGFLPIEIQTAQGTVEARIVEVSIPGGAIPGKRGRTPSSPALLLTDVPGEHGWSGSMVREIAYRDHYGNGSPAAPYGMFMGIREMYTGPFGRVHMLHQHEIVWGVELIV